MKDAAARTRVEELEQVVADLRRDVRLLLAENEAWTEQVTAKAVEPITGQLNGLAASIAELHESLEVVATENNEARVDMNALRETIKNHATRIDELLGVLTALSTGLVQAARPDRLFQQLKPSDQR